MILAEHAAKVATREEDGSRTIMALYAWLFAEMRSDNIDLNSLRTNKADTSPFVPVNTAQSRTEVAVPQMPISGGCFFRGFDRREKVVLGNVIVKEEWWS